MKTATAFAALLVAACSHEVIDAETCPEPEPYEAPEGCKFAKPCLPDDADPCAVAYICGLQSTECVYDVDAACEEHRECSESL